VTNNSDFIKMLTFMMTMSFEIFLPCYFGNELSKASSKLSTAVFHSQWTRENKCDEKCKMIFMENLKKDMKISAWQFFNVNLESFTTIVNATYSLYAVLQKLNAK
jgi:odorant receptor